MGYIWGCYYTIPKAMFYLLKGTIGVKSTSKSKSSSSSGSSSGGSGAWSFSAVLDLSRCFYLFCFVTRESMPKPFISERILSPEHPRPVRILERLCSSNSQKLSCQKCLRRISDSS